MLTPHLLNELQTALAGRYDILNEAGRGGMATVFVARDVKHDRRVALKVLDPDLGAVLGAERFLSEIRVTANLQHPNLLPLFDSGDAAGLLFYVMPFVEGESLRVRLDREKQLPVDDAVRIAAAIANALEYAHARGVVHRDLKPENVLMQAGEPIVADFGIALAVSNAGGTRITQTGLSLGTPTYMSPEQATGDRVIDGRSDQYALGAMTYEMLTGEPPHTGATSQAIIARLLTETPRPIRATRPAVPERVDDAVLRALEKLPADRWPSVAAFRGALVGDGAASRGYQPPAPRRTRRRERAAYAVAGMLALACVALLGLRLHDPHTPPQRLRFVIPAPGVYRASAESSNIPQFSISDDGMAIAYVVQDSSNRRSLWVRHLDHAAATRVPGSDGALSPFWSPDGKSIGFFADGKLERYTAGEGGSTAIVQVGGTPSGAAWMSTGEIVLSRGDGPILEVPSRGGTLTPITTLDSARGELDHVLPQRLSDGRHFLYVAESYRAEYVGGTLLAASIDGGKPTTVMNRCGLACIYAAPNHLLVVRDADIEAVPFDPRSFRVDTTDGEAETAIASGEGSRLIAASRTGTVVWLSENDDRRSSIELVGRDGKTKRMIGPPEIGLGHEYWAPRLSPDGREVAAEHHLGQGGGDIYVFDIATGAARRETFDPTNHSGFVVWSPDGKRMAFNTTRQGGGNIFMKTVGAADDHLFLGTANSSWPSDWSRDGKYILFDRPSEKTQSDVWIVPAGGGAAKPILATAANEMQAVFSPDGQWIAYASDEENGVYNVYVRPFPLTAEQWKVSESGGEAPRWRGDGKELFFLAPHEHDVAMMSAAIETGGSFRAAKPVELFRRPISIESGILRSGVYYDVAADGQSFVTTIVEHGATGGESVGAAAGALNVFVNGVGAGAGQR